MSNTIDIGHGLSLKFTCDNDGTSRDVWVKFIGVDGKSAAISVAALAERSGTIVGVVLRSWASDRIDEHMAAKHE